MEISCEFKYIKSFRYTCVIQSVEFLPSPTITLRGDHYSDKTNSDVLELIIRDCKFTSMPTEVFKKFPNLECLYINESNLKSLNFDDVKMIEKLTTIELRENEIKKPDASLMKLVNLKSLAYYEDRIMTISRDFIKAIRSSKLTYLHIPCYPNKIEMTFDESFKGDIRDFADQLKFKMYWDEVVTIPDASQHVCSGMSNLFKTRDFHDFVIKVGDENFPVHRAILATHSSVFSAMFKSNMEESLKGEVSIVDFNAKTVEEFLEYIYTGNVPSTADADWMSLLEISGKYDVQVLKKFCESQLVADLDSENAFDVLMLANIYDCPFMKVKAFQQIKEEVEGVEIEESLINEPEKLMEIVNFPVKKRRI